MTRAMLERTFRLMVDQPPPWRPSRAAESLAAALDDEYKSRETYQGVIRDFGPVRPFINIVEAEARHISALLALFAKYAVSPPANPWRDQAVLFASVHEACVAGVHARRDRQRRHL